MDCGMGLTEILQKLKTYCRELNDNGNQYLTNDIAEKEDYLSDVLGQVLRELNGGEFMPTFEFIESGIVKSLAHYLCNGRYLQESLGSNSSSNHSLAVLTRFQTFAAFCLSNSRLAWEDLLLTSLVRKLQSALSSFDNFPVILSNTSKPRIVLADIPVRHSTMHPCLKVRFVREEGEESICHFNEVSTVELSSSMDIIEGYLWPKVSRNKQNHQAEPSGEDPKTVYFASESKCTGGIVPREQHATDMQEPSVSTLPYVKIRTPNVHILVRVKSRKTQVYLPLQSRLLHSNNNDTNSDNERRAQSGLSYRKKFKVDRNNILEFAANMMASLARSKAAIEVEYNDEVGSGLGPTMEFYTLASHEFQKFGLGMWREDRSSFSNGGSGFVLDPFGLYPRPWSVQTSISNGIQFSDVIRKFMLLGQLVAKAIKDRRILDVPFSRAFYKVILEQELGIYDIQSFNPELGWTLLELHALVKRKRHLESISGGNRRITSDLCFQNTRIEDLCLNFTLPGYSDYLLTGGSNPDVVDIDNLEEYVKLVVNATIKDGISRQVEAFKSGFSEVCSLKDLQIFTEDELERLLCGERDTWDVCQLLDHIKFDHGYTASSTSVTNLLEIIQEFGCDERRAFLQFVTGAPRLPPGGLAALNPKLTIVRKHCGNNSDMDLPSVMTCANYLKLPAYSSKERMRERLLYAITEGQGSFHLS